GCAVLVLIDLECLKHLRGDPAGARFVSREPGAIQNDDVEAGPAQAPRTGRSAWTAANDEHVTGVHVILKSVVSGRAGPLHRVARPEGEDDREGCHQPGGE